MLTVEVFAQRDLDPAASHAVDIETLDRAPHDLRRACLRVYSLAGDVLSLGRYHIAPAGDPDGGVRLHRRMGGGRVLPLGPGFAVLSFVLPHKSALVAEEPLALRPEQVLNRCVRGLIGGLRGLGVDAFYPGRDRITVDRQLLGLVSLEVNVRGAAMFEAVLALDGDWLCLPRMIEAVDRTGVIAVEDLAAAQVTSLAALGAPPALDELARRLAGAYAEQFGVALTSGVAPSTPSDAEQRAGEWIAVRRVTPELRRHAVTWGQLGIIEVYLAARDAAIADLLLAGDFIGDSYSLERLEQRLRGCALDRAAIAAVVESIYADPRSFLLGIGPLDTLVDTIVRAV
jgi:Bacterial lipoate protein ligase C-terminus